MSCCGNRRRQSLLPPSRGYMTSRQEMLQTATGKQIIGFEYLGRTSLTVMGPYTWQRYRFDQNGAVVAVDARDAEAMLAVPNLRPVLAT